MTAKRTATPSRMLVVDDDARYGQWLGHHLGVFCPDSTVTALDLAGFEQWCEKDAGRDCDILLLTANFGSSPEDPQARGLELLRRLRGRAVFPAVIALAEEGNELTAVRALQLGAVDYLPKRLLTPERLSTSVRLALRRIEKRVQRKLAAMAHVTDVTPAPQEEQKFDQVIAAETWGSMTVTPGIGHQAAAAAKPEAPAKARTVPEPEAGASPETSAKPDAPAKARAILEPEASAELEMAAKPDAPTKHDVSAQPEPAAKTPETAGKTEATAKPEAAPAATRAGSKIEDPPPVTKFGSKIEDPPPATRAGSKIEDPPPVTKFGSKIEASPPATKFASKIEASPPATKLGSKTAAPIATRFGGTAEIPPEHKALEPVLESGDPYNKPPKPQVVVDNTPHTREASATPAPTPTPAHTPVPDTHAPATQLMAPGQLEAILNSAGAAALAAGKHGPDASFTGSIVAGPVAKASAAKSNAPKKPSMPAPPVTAEFIPGYIIKMKIGESEKAVVYLATSISLGANVALKVSKTLRDDTAGRQFLEREYTAIIAIRDPLVVQIYDYGVHAGFEYLAMEYLLSGDLKARMQAGLKEAEALRYIDQIAAALRVVHNAGLLHRDLKPPNVMLRESDEVALIDFGLARALDGSTPSTRTGVLRGSPYYMSPEQAQGEQLDARSDFYSLGIMLYEMLTGRKPYTGGTAMEVLQQHVNSPLPPLPHSLARYEILLHKLAAKNRNERFGTADEIIAAVAELRTAIALEVESAVA